PPSSFLSNCLSNPHNISVRVSTSLEALFRASNILALMLEEIVMLMAQTRLGFIHSFLLNASATTFALPGW
ncbi:hypothetical protein Tco_0552589, partial [Tanacetum coccineum]